MGINNSKFKSFAMSELAIELIEENKRTKNPFLDLGNCGLKNQLPEVLLDCKDWLKELNLGDYYFDKTQSEWVKSKNNFTKNIFYGTGLHFIPPDIESLYLGNVQLYDINFLQYFPEVKSLYLSNNQIQTCSVLQNLQQLHSVALSSNQIQDYTFLENLTQLQTLYLSSNKITDIFFLRNLKELKYLNLNNNQVQNCNLLGRLLQLQLLDLSHNQIKDIRFLKSLVQLNHLRLNSNKIQDISPVQSLLKLEYLNLNSNDIHDITPLQDLSQLQTLDISYNNVTISKPLFNLNNLNTLQIDKELFADVLVYIPYNNLPVKKTIGTSFINITSTPVFPPIPIIEQGEKAIIAYFKSLEKGSQPLNEVKVMLVGDGAAGKTSLVKALMGAKFNDTEKQTHGIQIKHENLSIYEEQIKVHYWDFGGQEIMHATHQFFLTKDSVYILVLDGRRDERPEYWLKHIATFGGNAPVLVVLNKAEDNRAYDIVRQDLNKSYPNIKGYFKISCKTKEGIEDFKKVLHKELFQLDFRKTLFSVQWESIKERLRSMAEPHITYDEYYKICNKYGLYDKNEQNTLLGYLNSLGIVLHFEALKQYDTQVLNPLWLTQAVYRIINSPKITANGGQFNEDELLTILNDKLYQDYKIEGDTNLLEKLLRWFGRNKNNFESTQLNYDNNRTLAFIAKVMQQFELSYNLPQSNDYIIPDLLPVEPPVLISYHEYPLHFATEFYFLPPALLPRFIVQTNFNMINAIKWRTGVVLSAEGVYDAEAIVRVEKEKGRLHIHVKGKQKRDLLAYIRSVLNGLYESYSGLKQVGRITELLFLPDRPDIEVPYIEIEGLEKMGEKYYSSGKAGKKYKLKELFGEIENPNYNLSYSSTQPIKLFISYSKQKKKFRDELVTKLFPLIGLKENYLEAWHDEKLAPASNWKNDIDKALDNSAIVVCLLNDAYLASEFCRYEFERAHQKKKKIYPILINSCGWEEFDILRNTQGYYIPLEPIQAAKRPQKWQEVYTQLKSLVEEIKNSPA